MLAGSPVLTLPAPAQAAKAGACTIVGTAGDDVLVGTGGADVVCGLSGDDKILGRGGDDVLRGGGGDDVVRGGPGDDRMAGGRGGDRLFGQGGDDVVRGDSGDDEVVGGRGNDRLGGFRGADQMKGDGDASGFVDHIRCGPGPDTVSADPADEVRRDCETVDQSDPPTDITLVPSTISENQPVGTAIGELTAVDPDPGDSHSFTLVPGAGSADNSLVRIDGDRLESAVRYDFEADASLSVRVRATDLAGEFTDKVFAVTVTDTNDAPVAVDDDATATEDTQLNLPVSGAGSPAANDTDQDGDPLTVSAVSSPTGGTVSISGGQVRFVPAANLCGNNAGSFGYTVSDGDGGTDTGTVTVDITCVDDAPNAVDDDRTVAEDSAATALNVLANDADPENDPITIASFTDPAGGTVVLVGPVGAGTDLTYQPDVDFCNDPPPFDTFTYTVNGGDTATVRVTVTCGNDAPVAVDDDRTTDEDASLQNPVTGAGSPAANDTDVDGDTLTVTAVGNPTGGTVGIAGGQITFNPTANLCGNNAGSYDYTVSDGATPTAGTDTGTVTIDITCVNDAAVANDDSRTVAEDSGPTTFGTLLGNDTDVEGDPITITGVSDPANGTTSFTAGDVTYTPDANYCNDPGAPDDDTFTYTVNGGDTATVSVTVTCVNDAPVANNDSETVAEDDAATAFDVLGNDSDVEDDAITVSSASDPANGTVELTGPVGARTGLTYEPDPNYCNDPPGTTLDTFTYTVNGGDTATVSVTVTCVDDEPVAVDDTASLTMNDGATSVPVLANDTDVDGGPKAISNASDPAHGTVALTGGSPGAHTGLTYEPDDGYCNTDGSDPDDTFTYTLTPGGDTATVSVEVACDVPPVAVDDSATVGEDSGPNAIDVLANDTDPDGGAKVVVSSTDPANGTVVLTGGSPGAHTGLTYEPDPNYCNNPPGTSPDTFTYTLNGGDTATVSVTVTCADDAPVALDDTSTVAEDSGANTIDVLANDADVDGGTKTVQSVGGGANGSPSVTNGGADVSYAPDPNFCGSDSFTYTLNGGDVGTVSVTVTCVDDAPTVDNSAGATTFTEGDPPTVVDSTVTIGNPDGLTITGGKVSITTNAAAGDVLDWTDNSGGDSIVEGASTSDAVVLTGNGTAAEYQAALRAVTYANSSDDPATLPRTVTFEITTSAGTASDTKTVQVVAVEDPPVAVNDSGTVLEDAAATDVPVLTNDTDVDNGPKTISSATDPANGTVVLTGGSPGAHTGLTYQPDPNYCNNPPGTTPDTFTYTLNGGSNATVSMTVTCVNDAPVADDETFSGDDSAHGNTTLQVDDPSDDKPAPTNPHTEITGDILADDTDIDGPGPLTVTPGTFATNDGGSVTIEADGDFVFQPAAATSCTDTSDFFDYTVEDSGSPEQTDTGRVTIAIAGCVWYVNNNAAGNSGTSEAPFDTLAQAETASGSNHTVFVFDGNNTTAGYDTGFTMNPGERLIGEHEGLVVDPDQGGALTADTLHPASPGTRPTLTDPAAAVVDLDDGNEVRGFNIDPQGGGGIVGAAGDTGGGTIDDINVVDTGLAGTGPGLDLTGTTGTFDVLDFTYDNTGVPSAAPGVQLVNAGTVAFGPGDAGDPTKINKTGGLALSVLGTNLGTSAFNEITVAGSTTGGIDLTNITAGSSTTFGDGSGTDLDLTTTSGSAAAFRVSSGAGITVPAGGIANARATGGPAVDVTSTTGATLSFDDVDSTNSASDGINLADLGTGTFSASSGDISGAAGISFDLHDGSGDVTFPGNLNNGAGQTAEITSRDGGAVTLSGPIADTSDAGGGIVVSGNNAGSTTFSNASKVINTTTSAGPGNPVNNAIIMSASDGHTLTFSGGGLDIDATIGNGLDATTSGTLNVTGAGNTIVTTTGRALRVQDTDVGGSPLNFQSIASNGAPTGILLSNTGSNSSHTVTGSGGTCTNANTSGCSGGEIRNGAGADNSSATPDGTGIVLNNTVSPSFTRMHVHDHSNYAIRGTGVNGFTLANSVVNGTNGTNANDPFSDSSVRFFNGSGVGLQGTASVTNTHVAGGHEDNFRVSNTSGSLNRLTFDTVSIGANSTAAGNDGIVIEGTGTATVNVTLQNSTMTSSRGDLFQMIADGSGGGDLDFTGNTLTNNHPGIGTGGGGVSLLGGASAGGTFDINMSGTNAFRDSVGHAILLVKSFGGGSMTGTINNITVGQDTPGDNSGSLEGSAIKLQHAGGGGTASVDITNNTLREYNNFGIELQSGAGVMSNGTLSVNVTGNLVTDPGSNSDVVGFQGVALNSGVAPGDTFSSCLHLKSNSVVGAGSPDLPADDLRVRARQNTTVILPGYGGSLTDTAAIAAFLANQNDAAPNDPGANAPVPSASATKDAGATYSGAGTTCP